MGPGYNYYLFCLLVASTPEWVFNYLLVILFYLLLHVIIKMSIIIYDCCNQIPRRRGSCSVRDSRGRTVHNVALMVRAI